MRNHDRYIDPQTKLFAREFVEDTNCPVCGGSDFRFLFRKSGGLYHACLPCEHLFLSPAFREEALIDYYRGNHDVQGDTVADDLDFYGRLYRLGLNRAANLIPGERALLDYGCSTGIFLELASSLGWNCSGVELNALEAPVAREKGFVVFGDVIEDLDIDQQFSLITLWDVFEHIRDGASFLQACKPLLAPGGIVFIQTPNSYSLAARVMQRACNVFDGLEHVNLYSASSMSILAERNGFEVVDIATVISEAGVINNYLGYQDPYLGDVANTETVLGLPADRILDAQLGYKLQACLRLKTP